MPPPRRSNNFQDDWMKKEEFVEWLKPVRSCRDRAHCKLCLKNFAIGNIGISAVVSHMQSTKHKRHCNDQQQLASNPNSLNSLNFFATPSSAMPIAATYSTCNTVPIAITARTSPVLITVTSDSTRYLGSQFLGHATADDLLTKFVETMKDLNCRQLIQISMDGPSVNWSFIES